MYEKLVFPVTASFKSPKGDNNRYRNTWLRTQGTKQKWL